MYWVAYRSGSFPVKESYTTASRAQQRASEVEKVDKFVMIISPDETNPAILRFSANAIVSPSKGHFGSGPEISV